jgi:hypothetical protein
MNYAKILKRGWEILWSYKTLWIFGIILAFTTSSGFNGGGGRSSQINVEDNNYNFNLPSEIQSNLDKFSDWINRSIFVENTSTWIWIGIGIVVFILLLSVIFAIAKYVSQTALIKMVDTYEASGEKVTWRQGFRLGWSRQAWRLFLINLVIFLPFTLIVSIFLGCALVPVLVSVASKNEPTAVGIIAAVGLFFLVIFIAVVIGVILSLFMEIIYRECVLKGSGVFESIRNGWKKVTQNFKDVFLMWLILIGIRFGYFLVSIPVIILLLGVALIIGGGIGVVLFLILNATAGLPGWIIAVVVGVTIFILLFSLPKLFLDGLFVTYISSVWTLTYRELNEIALYPENLPAPEVINPATEEKDNGQEIDQEIPPAI